MLFYVRPEDAEVKDVMLDSPGPSVH